MTSLVVDASVITLALTDARDHEVLWQQLNRRSLHAPHLIDFEVTNALRGLVLGAKLAADDAEAALEDFLALPIVRHPGAALVERVWALRGNLNACDAAYVALAESLDCELMTGDAKLHSGNHQAQVTVYPG